MIEQALAIAKNELVKPFEGYAHALPDGSCKAYPDPGTGGRPWTIGWGSTGPDIGPETIWSEEKADATLDAHLLYFCSAVLKASPGLIDEPDRRLAAVISFAYNCGLGNYKISTFKKRVDAKDWKGAQSEIVKWNKAAGRILKGLTLRRTKEALYLG